MKLGMRFILVIGVAMALMGAGTLFAAYQFRNAIFEAKDGQARSIAEAASAVVARVRADARAAGIPEAEAKRQALAAIGAMTFGGDNYVFVFDYDGVALAWGKNLDKIGKNQIAALDGNGKAYLKALIERARSGGGFESYAVEVPGKGRLAKTSFVIGDDTWKWAIGSGVYTGEVDVMVLWTLVVIAAACVPCLAGFLALAYALSSGVTRPLAALDRSIGRMAGGELATVVPGTDRQDEVGGIARAVEVFRQKLIERDELKREEERRAAERQAQAAQMAAAVERFRQEADAVLGFVRQTSSEMASTAAELTQVADHNRASAGAAEEQSARDAENVSAVAGATEELSATVREVGEQIHQAGRTTAEGAELGRQARGSVEALAQSAERIGAIVDLIRAIADQTNLLALNATIEAARAGDAGRGFAIVASEVKALATQTTKATEEIAANVTAIQEATREAVGQIATVTETLGQIEQASTAIAGAVEEQAVTTGEISARASDVARGTADLSSMIGEVSSSATETTSMARKVSEVADSLREAAHRLDGRIQEFLKDVAA